jgi:predicted metal-binding protein
MKGYKKLEKTFAAHGFRDFKWIDPREMVVAEWVRMKCMYGCASYGRNACCPPNAPAVSECRRFFDEYRAAAVFHFEKNVKKPNDRKSWAARINGSLLKLEREVFLSGYQKAFLLFMDSCELCRDCAIAKAECKHPKSARPTPEGLAVDVFSTVRRYGYPIEVLDDYKRAMNRYAFLLIE